jgi:hypothetical protein
MALAILFFSGGKDVGSCQLNVYKVEMTPTTYSKYGEKKKH